MARSDFKSDTYDVNEIYTGGSKDEQGHSSNLRVKVPDSWAAIVSNFVSSAEWPEYISVQAFVRDAIFHRMHWASQQKNRGAQTKIRQLMELATMHESLTLRAGFRTSYQDFHDQMNVVFRNALSDGDGQNVRLLLSDFQDRTEQFDEPYRSKLLDELRYWEKRAADL